MQKQANAGPHTKKNVPRTIEMQSWVKDTKSGEN